MYIKSSVAAGLLFIIAGCNTQKVIVEAPIIEEESLDTLVVTAPAADADTDFTLPTYRGSATRRHDLLHTRLHISLDWENQHVLGLAELTLKPYFYATDSLVLDAKVFDIHAIEMDGTPLDYHYDGRQIFIDLGREYTRRDTFTISIDYTAKPNEGPSSGSMAISSNKGLFFIDPLDKDKDKPSQVWTQGETENSSRWFPTIDKPNERCSQEIFLTVDKKYQTLSNGVLVSSTDNDDGTRTDYWQQSKPHAPYLFMIGVGEYAVVTGKWKKVPLMYYVEPEYRQHARVIFNHTPEMLQFFSDVLDYPYPWDKYAQIVCRDYVSGAMENTGAVVFGDFVQRTARELMDAPNDDIVAHEMFHHWFGDLVTCESWSNLTLNEGFATYSEYLWREYKYGHDDAEKKRLQDLNGYLMSAGQTGYHDLIDFHYENREAMFDAHSYNKGGLIVHMLREYVGDEAFFAALKLYLTRNAYTDVEAHELRLAFEDTTGEDLNWFFNQWFYDKGHPVLDVSYDMDSDMNQVTIHVTQVQDPVENPPVFRMPVNVMLYYEDGQHETFTAWIDEREEVIRYSVTSDKMPVVAVLDGTHDMLAVINEDRSDEDYFHLYMLSDEYEDKYLALKALRDNSDYTSVYGLALKDESTEIRNIAIGAVDAEVYGHKLASIARNDPSSANRAKAVKKLQDYELAVDRITRDSSFWVIGNALEVIHKSNQEEAIKQANRLARQYSKPLVSDIAEIYVETGDPQYLPFFEDHISDVDLFGFFNFIKMYSHLATKGDHEDVVHTAQVLQSEAMDSDNYFKSYAILNSIESMLGELKIRQESNPREELTAAAVTLENILNEIVRKSSDRRLKAAFQQYDMP